MILGLHQSDSEALADYVHPVDIDTVKASFDGSLYCRVFEHRGTESDWLVLGFGDTLLRVRPNGWRKIAGDGWRIGDQVSVLSRNGINTPRVGRIVEKLFTR